MAFGALGFVGHPSEGWGHCFAWGPPSPRPLQPNLWPTNPIPTSPLDGLWGPCPNGRPSNPISSNPILTWSSQDYNAAAVAARHSRTCHTKNYFANGTAFYLRRRIIKLPLYFFALRVRSPRAGRPHGDTGCDRPIGARPSPPPCGWSTGFITTPLTRGRRPSHL